MENSHYVKESGNQYHRDFSRIRILGVIMRLIVRLQSETAGSGIQGPPDPSTAGGWRRVDIRGFPQRRMLPSHSVF